MIIFYTQQITPRLQYIVKTVFDILGVAFFQITTDIDVYKAADSYKINYSQASIIKDEIFIKPHSLLFENDIRKQNISCFISRGLKAFFKTEGTLPFDIFAASFFLISRYEEYLPHALDTYGRYAHTNSIAYKEGFLKLPLINLWLLEFEEILLKYFTGLQLEKMQFQFTPTYDIDIAYSYKGKGLKRNAAATFKELVAFKWKALYDRFAVVVNNRRDPFDTYDWLDVMHKQYNLHPIYFFLLAEKVKGYDRNLSPHTKEMQQLVLHVKQQGYELGIHPSWQSGDDKMLLQRELRILESMCEQAIDKSRQHYLRMHLPATYSRLLQHKIVHDYSMGYGSINGFRASVTNAFKWYDVKEDKATELTVHPFCFMDANAFFEQGFTAAEAAEELQQFYDAVKMVNGEMITIFHNHFITTQQQWKDWRSMYESYLQQNFCKDEERE